MKSDVEKRLRLLQKEGSIAFSSCSAEFRRFILPLLDGGVLCRKNSGSGQILLVQDLNALNCFIEQEFPHAQDEIESASSRIESVARFRDSKKLLNDVSEIVCVRGWNRNVLQCGGKSAPVIQATQDFGVFSFYSKIRTGLKFMGAAR